MIHFIKNNKWIIALSLVCIIFGILTFFTFIDRGFIKLNDLNLQILLTIDLILLGNGSSSKYWKDILQDFASLQLVDEKNSTLRARNRYWEISPPPLWLSWLPRELLIPPQNLDAIAALVLLEDYLDRKLVWQGFSMARIGL